MYNEKKKKTDMKYMKNSQSRIYLMWLKSDYEERIKPAIEASGMPVATFIKQAVVEKLQRDGLLKDDNSSKDSQ